MPKKINQFTLTGAAANEDYVPIWSMAAGGTRRIRRDDFIGATLSGRGTIQTGGFNLTVPKTGTVVICPVAGGIASRLAQWSDAHTLGNSTLVKSGAGLLTLNLAADATLTVPGTGTAVLGSGTATRIPVWSDAHTLGNSTVAKSGAGLLTLSASSAYTLTVPKTGTVVVGTGTSGRLAAWSDTNTVAASSVAKSGAGLLTLSAGASVVLTVNASSTLQGNLIGGGEIRTQGHTGTLAGSGTIPVGTGTSGRLAAWTTNNTLVAASLTKAGAGVITLNASGNYTLNVAGNSTVQGALTGGYTLTLQGNSSGVLNGKLTGGGEVKTQGYTLTVPGTGTAALLNSGVTFSSLRSTGATTVDAEIINLWAYNTTTAAGANLHVHTDGRFRRSTSSRRYKTDITDLPTQEFGLPLVQRLRPVTFRSKGDSVRRYAGLIAEEVAAAGGAIYVEYDAQGRPDGLYYAQMVASLVAAVQELAARLEAVEQKLR